MRYAKSLAAACTTAALVSIVACSHHTAAPARFPLADSTRANALSAMHGEAMAHAKYLAYAAQAQQAGRGQAAQQFTSAAHTELSDHFAREADLIGLGGDIAANLRDAISDETNEATTMYRGFAKQANADHDTAATALFTDLGDDEATHAKEFTTALTAVTGPAGAATVPAGAHLAVVAITAGQVCPGRKTRSAAPLGPVAVALCCSRVSIVAEVGERRGRRVVVLRWAMLAKPRYMVVASLVSSLIASRRLAVSAPRPIRSASRANDRTVRCERRW